MKIASGGQIAAFAFPPSTYRVDVSIKLQNGHVPMMQQGMHYVWLGDFETGSAAYTYTYTNLISDQRFLIG